ncbi:hypothetical protein MMC14_001999 [Varicellaria rhodocarpa]|nr:hypothetical protein [Varicellaria rhodocarpa]
MRCDRAGKVQIPFFHHVPHLEEIHILAIYRRHDFVFAEQLDVHERTSTVREALRFFALMRQPKDQDEYSCAFYTRKDYARHIALIPSDENIATLQQWPISKTTLNRSTHTRLKCTKCNEKSDGFRGPHELQPHTDHAHRTLRRAWVCVDISPNKDFLVNCEACCQNKKYSAFYSAAAHLRRTHFNKLYKGRKGNAKLDEKRGGKGGGEYPPMDVLKMRMQETEEWATENAATYSAIGDETLDPETINSLFTKKGLWTLQLR